MPSSYNKFYFIRHGETNFNKERRYTGTFNIPINEEGIRQTVNSLELLSKLNIYAIYSSPLKRALQTAIIISTQLNLPIIIITEFKERFFGTFQTKKKLNYNKKYFNNAQTLYQHRRKTIIGFNKIRIKQNILIVGHSGTYKALNKYLLNTNISTSIKNASPICFYKDNNKCWETIDTSITKPCNERKESVAEVNRCTPKGTVYDK